MIDFREKFTKRLTFNTRTRAAKDLKNIINNNNCKIRIIKKNGEVSIKKLKAEAQEIARYEWIFITR